MKTKLAALTIFIISLCTLSGEDFNDYYSSWSTMFGIDPNAGTNSFLILLIPSGGKHEGMATAYTAIAIDSGFIDSNPAASSLINNTELAFLHNNWINDVNLESIILATRIGNIGMGVAAKMMYLPFTGVDEYGDRYSNDYTSDFATGYYWETVGTANFSYNFLKNFYFDGISVGANLKVAYRNIPFSIATGQSALALMGDLGVMTRFNFLKPYFSRDKNFALGVSVKNFGGEFITNPDPLPTMFSAGFAYSPFRPLTMAFDFNLPFNLDGSNAQSPYFAVGFDLTLTNFLSMQGGVLLKSGLPRLIIGTALEFKKIDFVINYTLDLTTQFDELDRISLEVRFNMGDYGRKEKEERAEVLYIEGLKLYAEGDFVNAIKKWEECIELNPIFTPAKEMIETAFISFQLQEEMLNKQTAE
ncbi:MAG: UPF0164 family protein [Spirochaetaceae bacterium]|jgi:hypothetical protein|nr:UPF0164 family protein [Spirochaetaceae bacterium]